MSAVVFLAIAVAAVFALIALAVPAAKRIGVPLPVVVAVLGLATGVVPVVLGVDATSAFLDAYEAWLLGSLALDSQALLLAFLPPLLFEMALAVNVRRLLDDIGIVLVMAVVAVVLATGIVGLSVWMFSSFGLVGCLLLGAAISTTDPAAVVSTFREIGAPKRLLVILEGESLLNDAAAIALFTVLIALAGASAAVSPGGVALAFLYDFAVGGLCGVAVAWAVSRIYPLLGGSAVAEVSMTVALAYGAYMAAEAGLGASGVVSVVFAGLTTTVVGIVRMGPRQLAQRHRRLVADRILGEHPDPAALRGLGAGAAAHPALVARVAAAGGVRRCPAGARADAVRAAARAQPGRAGRADDGGAEDAGLAGRRTRRGDPASGLHPGRRGGPRPGRPDGAGRGRLRVRVPHPAGERGQPVVGGPAARPRRAVAQRPGAARTHHRGHHRRGARPRRRAGSRARPGPGRRRGHAPRL